MDFFLIQWITQLFQILWSWVLFVANLLYTLIVYVYNGLVWVALNAWRGLQALARLFTRLWEDVIKKGVLKLYELYNRLRDWLDRVLGPVLRVLRRIRQILDDIFNTYIKPILDVIQRIRRVLAAFRLLGFRWAERLDARLQRIENAISEAFLLVRRYLVLIIDTLERVVDLDYLLLPGVFGGSLRKWLGFLSALLGGLGFEVPENIAGLIGPQLVARDMEDARLSRRNWLTDAGAYSLSTFQALQKTGEGR